MTPLSRNAMPLSTRTLFCILCAASQLFAFSTSNVQLLYGDFDDNSYVYDTRDGGKTTLTLEHYRTWEYGDIFMFADAALADERFLYQNKSTDVYAEISPRISLFKSDGFLKAFYLSGQLNHGETYVAYLGGIGADLKVAGFDVFGLNGYKKEQNIGPKSWQLSSNYLSARLFGTPLSFEGFADWTVEDFLTQNQLTYALDAKGHVQIGSEWHYYLIKNMPVRSSTLQALIKLRW